MIIEDEKFIPTCILCGAVTNQSSMDSCLQGIRCPLVMEVKEDDSNGELFERHFTQEGRELSAADTVPLNIQENQ